MPCARDRSLLFAIVVALVACDPGEGGAADSGGSDEGGESGSDDAGSWSSLDERPCPEDSFLTWENFGGPYVLTFCTGCHATALPADMRQNAPFGVNLETVELVRQNAELVYLRAADQNGTMPPAGPPDLEERTLLGEWLACGAPTQADLDAGE